MNARKMFNVNRSLGGITNASKDGITIPCRNAYMDRIILSNMQSGIITAVLVLEMAFALLLNGLMIKGLQKQRMVVSITWQYILLLGYAGCTLSLFTIPLNIILFTAKQSMRSCYLEYLAIFIGQTNCQFIVYLILLLALHRYLITVNDGRLHLSWVKKHCSSNFIVALIFLLSLLHGGASIDFFGTIETSLPNLSMKIIDVTIGIAVFFIYLRLQLKIRHCATRIGARFTAGAGQVNSSNNKQLNIRRLAVTIWFILLALALCYIPFIIMDAWTSWYTFYKSEKAPQTIRFVYFLTYGFVFLTSIANAAIVIQRDRDLQAFVKSVICVDFLKIEVRPINNSNGMI